MPKPTDKDRVARWQKRVGAADKIYKKWETKYRVSDLPDYYYGHQYPNPEGTDKGKYTINEIFSSIETQMPSQLFYHPHAVVKARGNKTDDPGSSADAVAQLQEDTLNTFVSNRRLGFKEQASQCLLESYFGPTILEVGYSGHWTDNPNAGKPILKEGSDEEIKDADNNPVSQPNSLLKGETLYFKRIPSCQFRTGIGSKNLLQHCDWYGYFEWQYPEDIKRNKRYRNNTTIKAGGKITAEYSSSTGTEEDEQHREMVKVWKIWDLRGKTRYDFADGGEKFFLEEAMPLRDDGTPLIQHAVLKKHERLNEFLPLPTVFNWLSPQDLLNEQRNTDIKIKRKSLPKYGYAPDTKPEEIEKFLEADIVAVELPRPEAIWAIPIASGDSAALRASPITKEDFREVSGVSGEQRGIADADTATQANIISTQASIRDNKARDQVADWLAHACEIALWLLCKRMVLPFWVRTNIDPNSPTAQVEAQSIEKKWVQIQSSDIGGIESDVSIDIESLSPVNEQGERADWIQALAIVANPQTGPMILANDILLRKTLGYFHVRNEKDIHALKQFGVQALQMMMAAAQQKSNPGGGAQPLPSNQDIQGQLQAQIGASGGR